MGYEVKQNQTARPLLFLMIDSADHISPKTGLSPTVVISKNGAAFASPSGAVTEIGNGLYKVAGNATDADTLGPLALHATGTGADPVDVMFQVVAYDPESATNLGLSRLDENVSAAKTLAAGAVNAAAIATDAIDSDALAASAVTEIQSGLSTLDAAGVRSAVGLASADLDAQLAALPTAAENADAVWDEAIAGHAGAGSTGEALGVAGSAGDPWTTALPGSYTAGQAGKIVGDNLNATVSSRATPAQVNTEADTALADYDGPTNAEMVARTLAAASYATAASQTTILDRIGAFTGSGLNTILGFLRAMSRKTAALTPSDMGGSYDNTTDSLEAIRDRGDSAWVTGSGGSGGFDGSNEVTLRFRDASSNPVANVTFTVVGVGSGTTDGTGEITVSLNDGSYSVRAIPSSGVLWSPEDFDVSGDGAFNFDGVTILGSGLEERSASYLVSLLRNLIGHRSGQTPYRDGFASDIAFNKQSVNLLMAINDRQRQLSETGYFKCYFTFTTTAAETDDRHDIYPLDTRIHRVRSVTLTTTSGKVVPLEETSVPELDLLSPQHRNRSSAQPTEYWLDGDMIGFNFAPAAEYTITILAETVAPDLVLESDVPQKLPVRFHEMLAYGAAVDILTPKTPSGEVVGMQQIAQSRWDGMYEDLKKVARSKPLTRVSQLQPGRGRVR